MGAPVVIIHGMWCQGAHLARLAALLSSRTYDCRVLTLPAHTPGGDQPRAVAALSITDYVEAAARFVDEQGFDQPPVVIGHSMGGLIAQLLAARRAVAALVLLTPAAPAGIHAVTLGMLGLAWHLFARPGFWKRAHRLSPEQVRCVAANGLSAAQQDKLIPTLVSESGRAASEIAFWWADAGRATRVEGSSVHVPVYVVSAGQDRLAPASVVRKVAARYRQVTLRHWPARGHWVIDDADTEEMVHEIDGWLRPVLRRAARAKPGAAHAV